MPAKKESSCMSLVSFDSLVGLDILFGKTYYVKHNEILLVTTNGVDKLFSGPGYYTPTNSTDIVRGHPYLVKKNNSENNIYHGSIKFLYVPMNDIRVGIDTLVHRPYILGPGNHYIDNSNITILKTNRSYLIFNPNERIMFCPDSPMAFICVKPEYKCLIVMNNGEYKTLSAGLHFIESPHNVVEYIPDTPMSHTFYISGSEVHTSDNVYLIISGEFSFKKTNLERHRYDPGELMRKLENKVYNSVGSIIGNEKLIDYLNEKYTNDLLFVDFQRMINKIELVFNSNFLVVVEELFDVQITSFKIKNIEFLDGNIKRSMVETVSNYLIFMANQHQTSIKQLELQNKHCIEMLEETNKHDIAKSKLKYQEHEIELLQKIDSLPNARLRIEADAQVKALYGVQKIVYSTETPSICNGLNKVEE